MGALSIIMNKLNKEEQSAFEAMERAHEVMLQVYGTETEQIHIDITKNNGLIPWKAMMAYCDKHKTSYPDWPDSFKT